MRERGLQSRLARRAAGALAGTALVLAAVAIPTAAGAGTLEGDCDAVDRGRRSSCELERGRDGIWVLTTGLVVGSGAKRSVDALERRFCEAMQSRGQAARVARLNTLPGYEGQAARMEWSCAAPPSPSVSSAPPRMPSYGGAYLR